MKQLLLKFSVFMAVWLSALPAYADMNAAQLFQTPASSIQALAASLSAQQAGVLPSGGGKSRARALKKPTSNYAKKSLKSQANLANVLKTLLHSPPSVSLASQLSKRPIVANSSQPLMNYEQRQSLRALIARADSKKGLRISFDNKVGTPSFIKFEQKISSQIQMGLAQKSSVIDQAKVIAQLFLEENKILLKLDNPSEEMILKESKVDDLGFQHMKFHQQYAGIPIWGAELQVHLKSDQTLYSFDGRYQPTLKGFDTVAQISAEDARLIVKEDLSVNDEALITSELMIYQADLKQAVLSYKVDVTVGFDQRWLYFINAYDGTIEARKNRIIDAGSVVPTRAFDELNINRQFNVWLENNVYYLVDPTFPLNDLQHTPIVNPKASGDTIILNAKNGDGSSLSYFTASNANGSWDTTGVSALADTKLVYDYYKNTHQRDGIDDNNKHFIVIVHFENNLANAFWNGTQMVFGDGDGQVFSSLAKCLDVVAHEMTHGVIETTANLRYENQSGALNESFADIFATMVDRDDWTVGEDCTIASPGFLRNLENPAVALSVQPSKMSDYQNLPNTREGDNGGVHVNSGIPNHAAYLIADGLSNSIGKDKMERIFYRALTTYLTASSQFIDARRATLQAAEDIYGASSAEVSVVAAGWDAVEVLETSTASTSATSTDAVAGNDVMYYLYPLDGSQDNNVNDVFWLYRQTMVESNGALSYQSDLDQRIGRFATRHRSSKLAALTIETGTFVFYVSTDFNLHLIDLSDDSSTRLTISGDIWSIAISPDGKYLAYTGTDKNDSTLYVLDIVNDKLLEHSILPTDYQEGSNTQRLNTVKYADAISFDYTGKHIIFDALNCLSRENSLCANGGGDEYWTIGTMEVETGRLSYPFSNQTPDTNIGFPAYAQNNNEIFVFDASKRESNGRYSAVVLIADLEKQETHVVYDYGENDEDLVGTPSFWGDDNFITIQVPTNTVARKKAIRIPINAQWEGNSALAQDVNEFAVAMPLMQRQGIRQLTGSISAGITHIDFGNALNGSLKTHSFSITNTGNSDVNITNIVIEGDSFQQDLTNTIVPRESSITVNVSYRAPDTTSTSVGSITFDSDVNGNRIEISLMGNSVDTEAETSNTSDTIGTSAEKSGGGGLALWFLWLMIAVKITLRPKHRWY